MRSEVILQLAGNPISQTIDVNSDIGSNRSSSVSFGTCFSDFEDDILENTELVFQAISEEELEKHFYCLCVRAKMSLSKHHQETNIGISELYSEVLSKKIPVSQWKDYILQKITH